MRAEIERLDSGSNSTPVWVYMTWGDEGRGSGAVPHDKAHQKLQKKLVHCWHRLGKKWWQYKKNHPEIEMYAEDGDMPHRQAQIWRHPASGKPFGQILKKVKFVVDFPTA